MADATAKIMVEITPSPQALKEKREKGKSIPKDDPSWTEFEVPVNFADLPIRVIIESAKAPTFEKKEFIIAEQICND